MTTPTRTVLDPTGLSPDPVYGQRLEVDADGWARFRLHPAHCSQARGFAAAGIEQGRDRTQPLPALTISAAGEDPAELLIDFGTEVEAELVLAIDAPGAGNVYATFGESAPEARGLGGYGQGPWCQVRHWFAAGSGRREQRFASTGFRYVGLRCHDLPPGSRIVALHADCRCVGAEQLGDLRTPADPLLQRLWQTSLYTARACTRPDDLWDGIKRDRLGWYGDARLTQLALDGGFLLAAPAAAMLARLPVEEWVNGIPNFSCDAVMMLRDLIRVHGLDGVPGCRELVARVDAMLRWIAETQCDADGLIVRTTAELQFDYGFLDWSALPVGGRLDERFCEQAKHLEALRAAATIHRWRGDDARAAAYAQRADALRAVLRRRFGDGAGGFHHTLCRVRPGFEKYAPGWGAPSESAQRVDLGASGPTRHSSAGAVFADCVEAEERAALLARGFDASGQPAIITPMFRFYEQAARAELGAPQAAIADLRDWLAEQVCGNDSATIWESFEPEVRDFRRWGLHHWPKSLCHGWGAGLVPLIQRHGLGLEIRAPGCARIALHEPALPGPFEATVPTPHGPIRLARAAADTPLEREIPAGIDLAAELPA